MEIRDFLAAKQAMEEEIRFAAVQAVSKFCGATGYTPRAISVHMAERTLPEHKSRNFKVGQVKADVEL